LEKAGYVKALSKGSISQVVYTIVNWTKKEEGRVDRDYRTGTKSASSFLCGRETEVNSEYSGLG